MENRQSEAIYRAACKLLDEHELIMGFDKFIVFRPMAADWKEIDGIKEEWRTAKNVHVDMNPWIYFGLVETPGDQAPPKQVDVVYDWEGETPANSSSCQKSSSFDSL